MEIKTLKLKLTNCFLIPIAEKYLLIDTGYEWEWETFIKRLSEIEVKLEEISYVLLTHHHDDHVGLLERLISENRELKVIATELTNEYLKLGKHFNIVGAGYINKRMNFILKLKQIFDKKWTHSFPKYEMRATDLVISPEVEFYELGILLAGKIIATPGHTLDSISIILDDGSCIVGDAAANFLQFMGTKYCIIAVNDLEEYYRSWEKILSFQPKQIFPAHGKPFAAEKLETNLWKNRKENLVLFE